MFEIKLSFDAPARCRSFKTVRPAATLFILLIYSNGKELKKCAHTGRTRPKIVCLAAEMCAPGAECTLNFENWLVYMGCKLFKKHKPFFSQKHGHKISCNFQSQSSGQQETISYQVYGWPYS